MKARRPRSFDAQAFLESSGLDRTVEVFGKGDPIYSQGDDCETVMYLQKGEVTLSVLSTRGKEAIVAVLRPGCFFGESGLAGERTRTGSATASSASTVLLIQKAGMVRLLHAQHALSDRFIAHLLTRNARIEADLIDLLFNSAEKRLARALLLLARYGEQGPPQRVIPKVSQGTLAEIVGTTRSRVNFFMNRFKKLGFIEDNGRLTIHSSLLTVVLHE